MPLWPPSVLPVYPFIIPWKVPPSSPLQAEAPPDRRLPHRLGQGVGRTGQLDRVGRRVGGWGAWISRAHRHRGRLSLSAKAAWAGREVYTSDRIHHLCRDFRLSFPLGLSLGTGLSVEGGGMEAGYQEGLPR